MRHTFLLFTLLVAGCSSTNPSSGDAGAQDGAGGDVVNPISDAAQETSGPDAALDAGDAGDAAAPIVCGATVCRADQTCVAGKCAFSCNGFTVPGDYASVQAAIDGVATGGNDATICLGDQTYTEPQVIVRDTGAHGKALRIVGLSMDRSEISGSVYWFGGWSAVTFQGVHLAAASNANALNADMSSAGGKVSLIASRLTGQSGLMATSGDGKSGEIFLDGCDLAVGAGYAVEVYSNGTGAITATIQNSYAHGCGCATSAGTAGVGTVNLSFLGNTIVGCGYGLQLTLGTNLTALYSNDIFTGVTTTAIQWSGSGTNVTHHHNALWGNAANYLGTTDGPAYVKGDCLLGTSGPAPSLQSGSPCRGAGDSASAPPTDFFAVPRSGPTDIGAVQEP